MRVPEAPSAITKIDRSEASRAGAVAAEVETLLAAAGFAESPIFPVSSRSGEGIAALAQHLQKSAQIAEHNRAAASVSGLFRMPIDRAFTLPGIGLVVTGTVAAGTIAVGERLMISPGAIAVRVRGLHTRNRSLGTAACGERCAVKG